MTLLFARLTPEQAHTYSLVLSATAIAHTVHFNGANWSITVPAGQRRMAQQAIAAYLSENRTAGIGPRRFAEPPQQTLSALFVVLTLVAIHGAIGSDSSPPLFFGAFGADARLIVDGQFFRCITALLLHSDWAHLAGNAAFTLLFGTVTASIYGWGVGWLMILLGGAAGNLTTALWYQDNHLSVGASTAVFAALGICTVTMLWRRLKQRTGTWRAWIPLAGGLALVGWLGTAPRSDLMAHLAGFMAGLVLGGLHLAVHQKRFSRPIQTAALAAAVFLIVTSIFWGYRVSVTSG